MGLHEKERLKDMSLMNITKPKLKILFLEDTDSYRDTITKRFENEGHSVDPVTTILAAETAWRAHGRAYDVVILDRQIEEEDKVYDGLELLKKRRAQGDRTPAIILTARYLSNQNKLEGLALQAEYADKAWPFEELLLRTQNQHLNSLNVHDENIIDRGRVCIHTLGKIVNLDGTPLSLGTKEYPLVLCLAKNEGALVSQRMLLEEVWGLSFDPGTNSLQVRISRIRARFREIDPDFEPFETVRGKGYIFHGNGFSQ